MQFKDVYKFSYTNKNYEKNVLYWFDEYDVLWLQTVRLLLLMVLLWFKYDLRVSIIIIYFQ